MVSRVGNVFGKQPCRIHCLKTTQKSLNETTLRAKWATVEPRFSVSKYSVKPRFSVIFLKTKTKTLFMKQIWVNIV